MKQKGEVPGQKGEARPLLSFVSRKGSLGRKGSLRQKGELAEAERGACELPFSVFCGIIFKWLD